MEFLTGRGFITGKSGSGKSNTAGVLCEKLLDNGLPLLIVDTEGEYYGLKEKYEILHVGADEECDLQVGVEHAEKLAELALDKNIPIILDVSGYLEQEETEELIEETLHHLFNKEKKRKKPFLVLVEEIHEYLPEQGGLTDCGQMLIRVAKRGRKRGLGITGISQRPANVKKDFITQCNWRVWHRLDWDNDLDVVRRVLGKDYVDTIKDLDTGQGYLEADFRDEQGVVMFQRKATFDAGATPDLEDFDRPELKSVSADLLDDLQEISERKQREQNRIEQLEQQLDEKQDEIEELQEELDRAKDMSDMAEQFQQSLVSVVNGSDEDASAEIQQKIEEIREEKNERIRELEAEKEELQNELTEQREEKTELQQRVSELEEYEQAVEHMDELREGVQRMAEALGLDADGEDDQLKQKLRQKEDRIDELEATVSRLQEQGYSLDEEFTEKMDFLKHDAVTDEIERAAGKTKTKEEHMWDVLSVLVDKDRAQIDDIVPFVDVSRSSVSGILSRLGEHSVVEKEKRGKQVYYALNVDGMKQIIQQQRKRREMDELKNKVKSS